MSGKAASWTAATVVFALILMVGSWFLLISPKLDEAAEVEASTEDVQSRNDLLVIQNARLAADFARLDEYRASIAAIRVKLPAAAELSELTRTLDELAEDHELTIVALAPSTPVFVPSTADTESGAAPAPTDDLGEESSEGDESDGSTPPPAAEVDPLLPSRLPSLPTVSVSGLVAVPVSATLVGTLEDVEGLLADLQTSIDRTFLVTSLNFVRQDENEEAAGRPATELGDVEVVLSGYVYVLQDLEQLIADYEASLEPVIPVDPSDLPRSDRDPFPPIAGGVRIDSNSGDGDE